MIKLRRPRSIATAILIAAIVAACGAPQAPAAPVVPTAAAPAAVPVAASVAPTREPIAPVLTTAPTTVPTATPLPPATPTAPAATASQLTATAAVSLSKTGPWLVYQTDRGVIAANPDGSGQLLITDQPVLRGDLPDGASSHGWLALRIGAHSLDDLSTTNQTVTLTLVHLPDGQLKPIGSLLSPNMQQAIKAAAGDRTDAIEAGIAIFENNDTLKWSPDDRYLAFIAAIDGPSSDVYSYDLQTGQINRLTDGLNQAANLSWSPDSKWIVHEEVENFGTGAGWNVKAVWAAAPDGSQTKKVYNAPQSSGGEIVTGWRANDTFAVYTWSTGGLQNPRFVNLDSGLVTLIYSGTFDMLAIDPQTGSALYWLDYFNASQQGLKHGLYLDNQPGGTPGYLDAGSWGQIDWVPEARTFYISQNAGGVLGVNAHGVIHFDQESQTPAASPDGKWLIFRGDGNFTQPVGLRLYTRDGQLTREITQDAVTFARWTPDGRGLLYITDGMLYAVQLPGGQPVLIDQGAQISIEGGLGWVQP